MLHLPNIHLLTSIGKLYPWLPSVSKAHFVGKAKLYFFTESSRADSWPHDIAVSTKRFTRIHHSGKC